jgi:hypothetical protein
MIAVSGFSKANGVGSTSSLDETTEHATVDI